MNIAMGGPGKMDAHMAARLLKGGHSAVAYDLNKSAGARRPCLAARLYTPLYTPRGGLMTYPKLGDRAPDFSLATIGGQSVALNDYRGQPVLLVFLRHLG